MLTENHHSEPLHPPPSADDVVIARSHWSAARRVENVTVSGLIPPGHKVATRAIAKGEPVRRYNQIIGFAAADRCRASMCTRTTSTWARWATSSATTRSAPT